jgi:hypothetical protein
MVKKSYVMPVSNETHTRLRTGLLVGSGNTGIGADPSASGNEGTVTPGSGSPIDNGTGGLGDARRRSVSSVD